MLNDDLFVIILYPDLFLFRDPYFLQIPGRSGNDVNYRWKQNILPQKLKRAKTLETSVDAAPAHEK